MVNHQSATVTAVNLADFRVVVSLPVASQPDRVLLRPGTRQLYIVSDLGKLTVAAFPRLHVVGTLDVGRSATAPAFSRDGRSAYMLDAADREVVFLDCGANTGDAANNEIPNVAFRLHLEGKLADLSLSPDGKTLVVSSSSPDQLTFISTGNRSKLGSVTVGAAPGPMGILPDSSKVFVADTGEEKISVADIANRRLLLNIEIGNRPTALLVKPDGGEIYILAAASSMLIIADAFHDNVEQTFPLGRNPVTGLFSRDMNILYIANAGDGSVLALNVPDRQVLAWTHFGMEPRAMALTPDQRLLVVADRAASSLAILHADLASLSNERSALITAITVGGQPVDVVVPNFVQPKR